MAGIKRVSAFSHRAFLLTTILCGTAAFMPSPGMAASQGQPANRAASEEIGNALRRAADFYKAGKYDRAIEIWRPLAATGQIDAQFNMGQVYRLGRGVPADRGAGQRFYELAARGGHRVAIANLAAMLYFDPPPRRDRNRAIALMRDGAKMNEPQAQYMLGVILFNGDGVSRDRPLGYAWVHLAAAAGHPDAISAEEEMRRLMNAGELSAAATAEKNLRNEMPKSPETVRSQQPAPPRGVAPPSQPERPAESPAARPLTGSVPAAPSSSPSASSSTTAGHLYWLQLSSQKDEAGARKEAEKAEKTWLETVKALAPGTTVSFRAVPAEITGKGTFWRVRTGPFGDRAAAETVCKAIKAKGGNCLPVHEQKSE